MSPEDALILIGLAGAAVAADAAAAAGTRPKGAPVRVKDREPRRDDSRDGDRR